MKTLYITRGNNIVVDTENNTVDRISCDRTAIDDLYRVKEPMHVVYQRGEYKRERRSTWRSYNHILRKRFLTSDDCC